MLGEEDRTSRQYSVITSDNECDEHTTVNSRRSAVYLWKNIDKSWCSIRENLRKKIHLIAEKLHTVEDQNGYEEIVNMEISNIWVGIAPKKETIIDGYETWAKSTLAAFKLW